MLLFRPQKLTTRHHCLSGSQYIQENVFVTLTPDKKGEEQSVVCFCLNCRHLRLSNISDHFGLFFFIYGSSSRKKKNADKYAFKTIKYTENILLL